MIGRPEGERVARNMIAQCSEAIIPHSLATETAVSRLSPRWRGGGGGGEGRGGEGRGRGRGEGEGRGRKERNFHDINLRHFNEDRTAAHQ